MRRELDRSLQKLTKWRSFFAAWQLGTRAKNDAELKAIKDHRELTILLRAEVTAITGLLLKKGVFSDTEFMEALQEEAEQLSADYAGRFPGVKATEAGLEYDLEEIKRHGTMDGWLP